MIENILSIGHSVNLVTNFISGLGDRELYFSYGKHIPDTLVPENTVLWMGGIHAFRAQQLGFGKHLTSPGSDWLPNLPKEFLGRVIRETQLQQLDEYENALWVKPSEAKVDNLKPGVYTYAQLQKKLTENLVSGKVSIQYTSTVLQPNWEHRFFVMDGKIMTGSPYSVDGIGYHKSISWSKYAEAEAFLETFLQAKIPQPYAVTIDVGYNMETDRWFVVEANRPWSSGMYGADPKHFLAVVEASQHPDDPQWTWKPDVHLQLVNDLEPLRLIPWPDERSVEVIQFQKQKK